MGKVVRIGAGGGAFVDSITGPSQLIKKGDVQDLIPDANCP